MAEATSNFPNEGDAIDEHGGESQVSVAEVVIKTGADAAEHLHSAVTVRSIVLATAVSGFQAVMSQIYTFKPTVITVSGTFIVLISYFVGNAWARFLPRSDKFEAGWREKIGQGKLPWWISVIKFVNNGPWSLKEHSVCAITATSASNASVTSTVFAAQNLFYDLPLSATTVILSTISIGLFGYGLCGIMRPIAVWHVESVYWNTLPTVNTLHGLHWQEVKNSKPLRLLITTLQTSLPLKFQIHQAIGILVCFIAMLAIYYGDAWGAKSQPFMSTVFHTADGKRYPSSQVFPGDVLSESALAKYGITRITGTFAYAMFMANAATCLSSFNIIKSAREGRYDDRHHQRMATHYKETPWWWYGLVLLGSFILGLIVSTILYGRYGNGIAINNLSKMIAGLTLPGRLIGNIWFTVKIPPRVMFLIQIYGTVLGGFVNHAVMISIVAGNQALLANGNGNSSWSGANVQAYNTNAASWALAPYLYKIGSRCRRLDRLFYQFIPNIGRLDVSKINMAQIIQYAGFIPYNQSQA
ncbi:uncharacterized protein N7473_000237 [Penicillium subrubescens]|uniref:uncharacterized protein n=1 Tax=Penicillium subrubescens TaxID=1316194 RepID=UPI002544DF40|nr:uncharacterized protein N7473_000237 [Penicillium subrubescens]KAJ5910934.1 hypothetical protein N7473_000237 [Penicillium subrubescens]